MSFRRSVIRVLWSWFRRFVWPIIAQYVIDLVKTLLDEMKRCVEDWLRGVRERQEEARARADAARRAQERAEQRGDQAEAETQKRIAEVWREVAEMFRQENESLKEQVAGLVRKADSIADQVATGMDLQTNGDRPALMLGGRSLELPDAAESTVVVCPQCGAEIG